jgi:hypothetical protein
VLNLDDLPPNVTRLAKACFIQGISAPELMQKSAEEFSKFAAEAGLSFDEALVAMDWLSDFFEARTPGRRN